MVMIALASAFRSFFLLAALLAAIAIPAWTLVATQNRAMDSSLGPMGWHVHEMLFGYVGAVLAGFLLTAAKNWTSRETLRPGPLALLVALWFVGRVTVLQGNALAAGLVTIADSLFYLIVAIGIAIPIIGSRSRRNYAFPILILVIGLCDLAMHLHMRGIAPRWSARAPDLAIDMIVIVILLFGGRIVPLFTKGATEATIRAKNIFDVLGPWLMLLYAIVHLLVPTSALTHGLAIVVGLVTCARLYGWGGSHTIKKPILWVLHLSWLLLGLAIALGGMASLTEFVPPATFLHMLTVGGIGLMTLGMISRVSLGHTGRPLQVPKSVALSFVLILLATIARVAAPLMSPLHYANALWVAAALWALAFLQFLMHFAPILLSPRPDGKAG